MVARQLCHHPAWPGSAVAADLAAARDRLELMHAENMSVAAAFDRSYQDLHRPEQQRLFRCLGLHPGTDVDAPAAAALRHRPRRGPPRPGGPVRPLPAGRDHPGRYRFHDLIREHARALAAAGPARGPGTGREPAAGVLPAPPPAPTPSWPARPAPAPAPAAGAVPAAVPALAGREQALAWARAERANLLACLDHATGTGQHAGHRAHRAWPACCAATARGPTPSPGTPPRQAARQLGDRLGQAGALTDLGDVRRLTGDYPAAARDLEQALGIYRDLGDRLGQANALSDLGDVRQVTGDYPAAARDLEQALGIYRDLGDRLGQANALRNLGDVRQADR